MGKGEGMRRIGGGGLRDKGEGTREGCSLPAKGDIRTLAASCRWTYWGLLNT